MSVEVLVTTAAGASTHVLQLTDANQVFSIPSEAEPTDVTLDPNAWVFMRSSVRR